MVIAHTVQASGNYLQLEQEAQLAICKASPNKSVIFSDKRIEVSSHPGLICRTLGPAVLHGSP